MSLNISLSLGFLALFFISFLGNGPFPLPLTATILWLGRFHFPLWVVAISTLGSLTGWILMEGPLRRWIVQNPTILQRIPASYQAFFLQKTGLWLFIFNALPFPLDFMRFLALFNGYSRIRLCLLLTLARTIRHTILVWLGANLASHPVLLWTGMLIIMALPVLCNRWLSQQEASPEATLAESHSF